MLPKFNLLYFKNLLDVAFNKFFDIYNDYFSKIDGNYVLSNSISKTKLKKIFKTIIVDTLKESIEEYDILKPLYYVIIGACMPKLNLLLKYGVELLPQKLANMLNSKYQLKYALKEDDIKIDSIKFNEVCIEVFNDFFIKDNVERLLGKNFKRNVLFILHNRLDCYTMFKVLKSVFGKANCNNLYILKFKDVKSPIIAINDLIDKYATKSKANNDIELIKAISEIKAYLKEVTTYGN